MIDAYTQTLINNARITHAASKSINDGISHIAKSINDWWNEAAKPWLYQAICETSKRINKIVNTCWDAWRVQEQMKIEYGKITSTWLNENGLDALDVIANYATFGFATYGIVGQILKYTLHIMLPGLSIPLVVTEYLFATWCFGRYIFQSHNK